MFSLHHIHYDVIPSLLAEQMWPGICLCLSELTQAPRTIQHKAKKREMSRNLCTRTKHSNNKLNFKAGPFNQKQYNNLYAIHQARMMTNTTALHHTNQHKFIKEALSNRSGCHRCGGFSVLSNPAASWGRGGLSSGYRGSHGDVKKSHQQNEQLPRLQINSMTTKFIENKVWNNEAATEPPVTNFLKGSKVLSLSQHDYNE